MNYWDFVNLKNVPSLVREAAEDIYLILNNEWNYEESKETEKMIKLFENSEELLEQVMSMKVVAEGKEIEDSAEPEKLLEEIKIYRTKPNEIPMMFGSIGQKVSDEEVANRKKKELSVGGFVFKMAVYRFIKVHFPKVFGKREEINIAAISGSLDKWELMFWVDEEDEIIEESSEDIFTKRRQLRDEYDINRSLDVLFGTNRGRIDAEKIEVFERALEDVKTVRAVKEMQLGSFSNFHSKEENNLKETQSIKHLIDIMDRDIKGELTEQDKIELRENAQNYSHDIESLMEMIKRVSR